MKRLYWLLSLSTSAFPLKKWKHSHHLSQRRTEQPTSLGTQEQQQKKGLLEKETIYHTLETGSVENIHIGFASYPRIIFLVTTGSLIAEEDRSGGTYDIHSE